MTTTAAKSTGRVAHARRTAKAAQRTPLPPKGSTTNPASTTATIAKAATDALASGNAKVAAARKRATKAAPATPADPTPVAATPAQKRAARRAKTTTATATPKAAQASKPEPKAPVGTDQTKPATEHSATIDTFAGSKPKGLAGDVLAAGWTLGGTSDGKRDVLVASRGIETIEMAWDSNVYDRQGTYTVGGKASFCANMATARRYLQRDASEVKAPTIGGKARSSASDDTSAPQRSQRIADLVDAEDSPQARADILNAVQGHTIKWLNPMSQLVEEDFIPSTGDPLPGKVGKFYTNRHLSITTNPEGRRMINWCGQSGFHSAFLENVVKAA